MMKMLEDIFEPCNAVWRGIGSIEKSGLKIKKEFEEFDAALKFDVKPVEYREPEGCRCGEILTGKMSPKDCELFGSVCTPSNPIGACMVSSEGTCAAHYKYCR
jgi:hydrogenase expression/formation protein HypD